MQLVSNSYSALMMPPERGLSPMLRNALLFSLVLHAIVLSIHFTRPDPAKLVPTPQTLDVVLVNSKTKSKPVKAEALAQANLDGGGNTDEDRRLKTPMPVTPRQAERGDDVKRAQRRVQELEAKQRELMTKAQAPQVVAPPEPQPTTPTQEPTPQVSGADLRSSALALARMEAQIARQVDEYQKRPRKQFVGARTQETRFAQYVEDWRLKVERIGNLNYPDSARGRIYGSLRMTVSIKADGSVESMQIERPSGHQVLDRAAEKIVRMAGPFAPFPADIRRDTDILVITRTWTFAPGDKLYGE